MPAWDGKSHGIRWRLELERAALLPGRLATGLVTVTADDDVAGRSLRLTLIGTETWQHEQMRSDGKGTETVTSHVELPHVPIELEAPVTLTAGETRVFPFELPVPPLGPATVEATVLRVGWTLEAKIDRSGFDSRLEVPVTILQPIALLRAGVVRVAQFALFPEADAAAGDISGSVLLDPLPLVAGSPFRGRLVIRSPQPRGIQELRAEVRVQVESTGSGGKQETITPWAAVIASGIEIAGEQAFDVFGQLAPRLLPTIATAHGRTAATFHAILATAWARDPHLVRDVTIATTLEL
jgi:hypothetical protein